ncbi:MAG: single-stranded-DNA-specific exonuclease RecJ [Pseudomonadota bacterium]
MIPPSSTASGLPWQLRHDDGRVALAMAQQHGVSELMGNILAGRGVALAEVPQFLNPTLRDSLPDPFHLLDMDKAVTRLIRAIAAGERIAVFGDYDVDGATSTALLSQYFSSLGIAILPYIPDRMTEGYGPSIAAFDTLIGQGAQLIITVDCGTLAHGPIAHAQARGVDVIVLDHHLSSGALPNAHAIVNPNRVDEASPHRNLAAVGVTFLTLVALNQKLKGQEHAPQPLPNLLPLLDIVALGTVCDVMTLTGLNRAFVAQGLKVMAQRRSLGLSVLSDVARLDGVPNVYHLGFLLGPRINAGGRVGASGLGVQLLTATDAAQAQTIAARLDLHNQERQAIEAGVSEQAFALAAQQSNMPVIMVAGEGWHQGVIGIVAGRLKEKFSRPAVVIALENGIGKASARSVAGADMGAAVHAALAQGLLEVGGGHAMAAGFTLRAEKLAELHSFFIARMEAAVAAYNEARVMKFDGFLSVSGATLATLEEIAQAGPYGLGNPGPRFVINSARILHQAVMKEKHLRVTLGDASGSGRLNAVAFNAVGTPLGTALMQEKTLHLLGELKRNEWQGRETAQFMIDDVAKTT